MKRRTSRLFATPTDARNGAHAAPLPESTRRSTDSGPLPNIFLTLRVHDAFDADSALRNARIAVETCDGVVKLSGAVRAHYVRQRAVQLATAVMGVCSVRNCLQLRPPPDGDAEKDREGTRAK